MFTNHLNFFSESVFDLVYPNNILNSITYNYVRPAFESLPIVRNNNVLNKQGFMLAYGSTLDTCISIYPSSNMNQSPQDGFVGMSLYTNMNGDFVTYTKNPNLGNSLHAFKTGLAQADIPATDPFLKYYGVFDYIRGHRNGKNISWGDDLGYNNLVRYWTDIPGYYQSNTDSSVRMRCRTIGYPQSNVNYAMECMSSSIDDPNVLDEDNKTIFYRHQIHNNVRRNDPLLPESHRIMMNEKSRFKGWFHGIYMQNMGMCNVVVNYSRNGDELVYSKSLKKVLRKDRFTGNITDSITEFHMHNDIRLVEHPNIPTQPVVAKVYAKSYHSAHDYQYLFIKDLNPATIHDCDWIID